MVFIEMDDKKYIWYKEKNTANDESLISKYNIVDGKYVEVYTSDDKIVTISPMYAADLYMKKSAEMAKTVASFVHDVARDDNYLENGYIANTHYGNSYKVVTSNEEWRNNVKWDLEITNTNGETTRKYHSQITYKLCDDASVIPLPHVTWKYIMSHPDDKYITAR